VSKTDLQGRITYINKDFLDISGFTEAELIGEPHNIVRHPDMPAEAFADLWEDAQGGPALDRLRQEPLQERRFYWVLANATPIARKRAGDRLHVGAAQGRRAKPIAATRSRHIACSARSVQGSLKRIRAMVRRVGNRSRRQARRQLSLARPSWACDGNRAGWVLLVVGDAWCTAWWPCRPSTRRRVDRLRTAV
jgi:PAS domain S-box-containing protein